MNLDDRLRNGRSWLDATAVRTSADPADLDRRHRRHHQRNVATLGVIVLAVAASAGLYAAARDDVANTVSAGVAAQPESLQQASNPEAVDGPAFVLPAPPDGWQQVAPLVSGVDHSSAFAGEEFSQVYVRFGSEQDPFSNHEGSLTGSIRVAVGTYDAGLRDIFAGPSTPVTIGEREFDLIETTSDGVNEIALIPVDVSERTYVLVARGIDSATALAMAEPIDPALPVPRIGDAPDEFTVIYSGPPEYALLDNGTSVTYSSPGGDQTFTVTTYHGVAISCFSNAWAYSNSEITQIGGDAGVIAQLDGQPGATGTYRALWNHDHDTLIGVTANGIDRVTLIDLANQLVLDDDAGAYQTHLELIT